MPALLALACLTLAASTPQDDVAARDRELNAHIAAHRVDAARAYYLDDFVLTTGAGRTKTLADVTREIASPELVLEVNETSDVVVRVHGDTAVLTGTLRQRGTWQGKPIDATLRVTDTWVRTAQGWQLLAGQAGSAPANPAK